MNRKVKYIIIFYNNSFVRDFYFFTLAKKCKELFQDFVNQ